MRQWATLKELLDYCFLCPMCLKKRFIDLSVGPDTFIKLLHFDFNDNGLNFIISAHNQYRLHFLINSERNTFSVSAVEPIKENYNYYLLLSQTIPESPLYIYFNVECKECKRSNLSTSDISLHLSDHSISNLGIEDEARYLISDTFGCDMFFDWELEQVSIYTSHTQNKPVLSFAVSDLDFSNQEKLIDRLKTLHFFT